MAAFSLFLSAAAGFPADGKPPVASAVKLETAGNVTRLVFDLDAPVEADAWFMANPARLVVDLPEVEFRLDPSVRPPPPAGVRRGGVRRPAAPALSTGLVSSWRFGLFSPGKSRIVVDLAGPARLLKARAEPVAGRQGTQLVLELTPTDRAAFAGLLRKPAPAAAFVEPSPRVEPGALPLVVLDPGHGGVDSGARASNGALEKDVVFEFARALMERLRSGGRYQVTMTRTGDVFVPLGERVRIARAAGAALFVSIHADTLGDEPGVSGATVYTVSEKATDAQAARVAEKENLADAAAGLEGGEEQSDVSDILFDLTRRETRVYSHAFAKTLVGYFRDVGRLNKNPQRAAGFRVLKAPDVPSVLLELGYLSNDRDLASLTDAEWRDRAAGSVERSIADFFRLQGSPPPVDAGEPPVLKKSLAAEEPGHVATRQR